MSDYNLGTAHGRIVITYDGEGTQKAQSDFKKVAESASWLHARLRAVGSGVSQFANTFGSDMNRVGRSVSYVAGAGAILLGLTGTVGRLGGSLLALRGGASILGTLALGFRGIPQSAQGFPRIIQQMILLSAGLTALRSGTRVLSSIAGRFALLRPFAPVLRGLGDGLFRLGRPIRVVAGLALAVAGLISGVGIATRLAKAVISLGGAFAALNGVVGIVNGIIGAISQLSGVLGLIPALALTAGAALATLATGFSGIGKALKFVAPAAGGAAGGMNQAAQAAKSAARSIAAAQRGVQDALRDQARTVRDTGRQIEQAQQAVTDAVESAAEANINAAKRVKEAQKDLAKAVQDAARSAEDSARRVASAQKNVARTAESSARSVESASRGLQSAIKNEAAAYKGLDAAQKQAIQNLKDLKELTSDLALDQEGAAIALIEAQNNLERVNSDALSTELDRRKAQYELATAQERVNDVNEDAAKTAAELADAEQKGIDGNQGVIDALDAVKEAQQSVTDAQDEFVRAGRDAAEANIDAAQDLADAVRDAAESRIESEERVAGAQEALQEAYAEQSKTAAQGARDIAEAQNALALAEESAAEAREDAARRVEDAYRQLAEAQEDAAQSMAAAAGAAGGAEDPINKLGLEAQQLVRTLRGLSDEWDTVKKAVQNALFDGIAEEVQGLADIYLPRLRTGMVGIAREFNLASKDLSAFFKTAQTQSDFSYGFELARQIIGNLRQALVPLMEILRDVGIVGGEALRDLTGGVGDTMRGFADFIAEARKTGDLRAWIDRGVQGFRDLWGIVRDVGASIKLIFNGIAGNDGSTFLADLAAGAAGMRDFLESAKGQEGLRQFGDFLDRMSTNTLMLLRVAFENLWPVIVALQPLMEQLSTVFAGVFAGALQIISPLLLGLANALSFMAPVLAPILGSLLGIGIAFKTLGIFVRLFLPLLSLLVSGFNIVMTVFKLLKLAFLANPWVLLAVALAAIVYLIVSNWDFIWAFLQDVWNNIKIAAQAVWDGIVAIVTGVVDTIMYVFNNFTLPGLLAQHWDTIWAKVSEVWNNIVNFFKTTIDVIWSTVTSWLSGSKAEIDGAMNAIRAIWDNTWAKVKAIFEVLVSTLIRIASDTWNNIVNGIKNMGNSAMGIFKWLVDSILGAFAGAGTWLWNVGRDIVMGLWNGIAAMGNWLWNQIVGWAKAFIPGPILQFLGIASPSKLFRDQIGKMIPAGLMVGIDSMSGKVAKTAVGMVEGAHAAALTASRAADLTGVMSPAFTEQLSQGVAISGASAARDTAAQGVPVTAESQGNAALAEAATIIENLTLQVAGNLDPTNKLAWDQAMDGIREGIRKREKVKGK